MSENITVNDLIIRSFATIGIYSPHKILGGQDELTALYHLNELLDYYEHNGLYLPFYSEISFALTVGQNEYVISKALTADVDHNPIVELDYVNLIVNNVSYPVRILSYDQVDLNVINTETQSRPDRVVLQRGVETSKVIFYTKPDVTYDCLIKAKTYLSNVALFDPMSEVPGYYHRFLRYALARELQDIYKSANWTPDQEQKYQTMLKEIKGAADFPLAIDQNPTFGTGGSSYDSSIGVLY